MRIFKLIIILMVVSTIYSCKENNSKSSSKSSLEELNLKGKVRRIIENSYYPEYKFGEPQKGQKKHQKELLFNEQGTLIEEKEIGYFEGVFSSKRIYRYNDTGLILEMASFDSKESLIFRDTYEYNESGSKVAEISYNSDQKIKDKTIYDEKGNEIERVRYDSSGKIEYKESTSYDEKGNVIEGESYELGKLVEKLKYSYKYDKEGNEIEAEGFLYDSEGKLKDKMKTVSKRDTKGNLSEKMIYDLKGNLESKLTYKYDKYDNETEFCRYDLNGKLLYKRSQKVDDKGNKLKNENSENFLEVKYITLLGEGSVNFNYNSKLNRETFEYNSYGDLVKEIKYESYLFNEVIMSENEYNEVYDYKYDKLGNWNIKTERFVHKNSIEKENVMEITEREIEYY